MFLCRILCPLNIRVMAEDIKMNQFASATDAAYVYVELADGSQGKIKKETLMSASGLFNIRKVFNAEEELELPYVSGLIMVQNDSGYNNKSSAILYNFNYGDIIVNGDDISFFSEVENKICVFSKGNGMKYVVKNKFAANRTIRVTFIE